MANTMALVGDGSIRFVLLCMLQFVAFAAATDPSDCTCPVVKTIKFGQSAPFTGSNSLSGIPIRDGILAAFHEFNQDSNEDKKNLRFVLDARDDKYVASLSQQNMLAFAQDPDVYGILGNFGTTAIELAAPIALQHNMPFFSAYGGMGLRQTFQRNIITLRGSYFDESAAIVEYVVSKSKKRISIFAQNDAFGMSAREGVMAALDSLNLYLHSEAYYTKNMNSSVWEQEVKAAIKNMTSSLLSFHPPDAIVIAAVYEPAAMLIHHVHSLWPETDVVCLSSVSIFGLVDVVNAMNDSTMYERIYSSQLMPNLDTSNFNVVARFRAAADQVGLTSSNYLAFEGYLMARLVIEVFSVMEADSNYTQDAFLDAIYQESYFNLDGLRVGPFYSAEINGGCNQGIQGSRIASVHPNKSLSEVFSLSFSTCGYRRKSWNKLTVGQSCSFSGDHGTGCADFHEGLQAAFREINDAGGVRGTTRLLVQTKDDQGDPEIAQFNNFAFLQDPEIFALVGMSSLGIDQFMPSFLGMNKLIFGAFSGDQQLRRPFHPNIVNFRASTDDEIFAIVHYCYYTGKHSKFSVLFEDTDYGKQRRDQLEAAIREKRWSFVAEASYASAHQVGEAVQQLLASGGSQLDVVVYIGLDDVLGQILPKIHTHDRNILVFGLSETQIGLDLTENEDIAVHVNFDNLLFTSVVPNPGGIDTDLNTAYTNALANLNPSAVISIAGLEGYVVGQLLATALSRIMAKDLTVANMLDTIYENGNFDFFGLRCGPLQIVQSNLSTSTTSKKTSCNQCMKKVFLTKLNGDMMQEFVFDTTCMYDPVANVDFDQSVRLPFFVLACLAIAYTLLASVLLLLMRRNAYVKSVPWQLKLVCGVGALLVYVSVLVSYPVPSDITCLAGMWTLDLGFVALLSPILARLSALERQHISSGKRRLSRIRLSSNNEMTTIVLILVTLNLFLLVAYSTVDPPRMVEDFTGSEGLRLEKCKSKSHTFEYLDSGFKGLILLWGLFLCQQLSGAGASSLSNHANESKRLMLCVLHSVLVMCCHGILKLTTENNPDIQFACVSMIMIENTVFIVTLLLARPVYKSLRNQAVDSSSSSINIGNSRGSITVNRGSLNGSSLNRGSLNGLPLSRGSLNGLPLSRGSLNGLPLSRGSLNGLPLSRGSLNGLPLSRGSLNGSSLNRVSVNGSVPKTRKSAATVFVSNT